MVAPELPHQTVRTPYGVQTRRPLRDVWTDLALIPLYGLAVLIGALVPVSSYRPNPPISGWDALALTFPAITLMGVVLMVPAVQPGRAGTLDTRLCRALAIRFGAALIITITLSLATAILTFPAAINTTRSFAYHAAMIIFPVLSIFNIAGHGRTMKKLASAMGEP